MNVIESITRPHLRALIVDRDAMSSHLLADALIRDRRCVAAAIPYSDLLQVLATREIELVVISADLNSRPGSGLELANKVCRAYPAIILVVLLDQTSHESVISAFRAGARGVYSRQQTVTEFIHCIQHVSKGLIWAGRKEADVLLEAFKSIPAPNVSRPSASVPLTKRELEVVQCAAKGKTNKVIAKDLGLSEHTVKNYLFRAFDKLGVSSRVELLFYLTIHGRSLSEASADGLDTRVESGNQVYGGDTRVDHRRNSRGPATGTV